MRILLIILLSLFLLFACKDSNPVSQYGDAMIKSYQRGQDAGKTGNLHGVKQAVQAYRAAYGSYPERLEDVEEMLGTEVDFSLFEYDPRTGTVNLAEE